MLILRIGGVRFIAPAVLMAALMRFVILVGLGRLALARLIGMWHKLVSETLKISSLSVVVVLAIPIGG